MAERENSVLFSLQELRRLEDDRVKREQDEARARADADRRAREETERQAREAEEARRRAEEDRVRSAEEQRQAKIREEQLRLEEAERRARVEGELKLQEQRLHLEMQSRQTGAGRSPVKAIVGVAALLVAIGGIVGYRMYSQHKQEQAALQKQLDDQKELTRAAQAEYDNKIKAIRAEKDAALARATSEAERNRILAEAQRKESEAEVVHATQARKTPRTRSSGGGTEGTKAALPKVPGKRDISDGILDGL